MLEKGGVIILSTNYFWVWISDMTIPEILMRLEKQCADSIGSINDVNKSEYLVSDSMKRIQDLVVKQAFLCVFSEWEHFLENATIAYSLGEHSTNGNKPLCYIVPQDEDHANRLIKGTAPYPDWSQMQTVKELEMALFKDGEPFISALNGFASRYKEMKTVRNHIAHNSIKSQNEFDTLVRNVLRASSVGISTSEFLLSKKGGQPPFFEIYISCFKNAATIISSY